MESKRDRKEYMREYQRRRRHQETEEQKRHRLEQLSNNQRIRLTQETEEERQIRLEILANNRRVRLLHGSVENRNLILQNRRNNYNIRTLGPHYRLALNNTNVERYDAGNMDIKCQYCQALHFRKEQIRNTPQFNLCCNFGNVQLDPIKEAPQLLKDLFNDSHPKSINFRSHIRNYNNSLAMASMGAQLSSVNGRGPYCYKIHGMVYHRIGPAVPSQSDQLNYGALYFMDADDALYERMGNPANSGCDDNLMNDLAVLLGQVNPYVRSYQMMRDIVEQECSNSQQQLDNKHITMVFDEQGVDRRRYNAAASNEVAIVYVSEDGEIPIHRNIAVHHRGGGLRNISYLQKECDPLIYPLLFPMGDYGWHVDLQKQNSSRRRSRITQKEFYCFHLAVRDRFSTIHKSGKLLQQYIVDAFVKIEQNRLNYIRTHQTEIRAETYSGLVDHLADNSRDNSLLVGRRCVLPASFYGSPRSFVQAYQDSMAIVRRFGKPDYFITFTCNPQWPEIQRCLSGREHATDIPHIVARVFQIKMQEIQNDIFKNHVLGKILAYVWVIEFQKRGLPHCHMLAIMDTDDKPKNVDDVNSIVSAELPDETTEPLLFQTISRCMLHGPCGDLKPNAVCMSNGECTKKFPKSFINDTNMNNGKGYPEYRRREDGRSVEVGGHQLDNRWVVPYNNYLSKKYNAHINVEICATIASVKYLYKYVYKGADRAKVNINQKNNTGDEIQKHLDARYISAPEAAWKIFGYNMQGKSHSIQRLAVHLPNEQEIYFNQDSIEQVIERENQRFTTLTAWFKINNEFQPTQSGSVDPRELYYHQIPEHFIFTPRTGWKPRQRNSNTIGRLYSVTPSEVERYHLRILLLNIKGAKSFDDLKIFDGVENLTFFDACKQKGLIFCDVAYDQALEESSSFKMPWELRTMFVSFLVFCQVSNVLQLWDKYKDAMAEDFIPIYGCNATAAAYQDIEQQMLAMGKHLSDFIPPITNVYILPKDVINRQEFAELGQQLYTTLNEKQKLIADHILKLIPYLQNNCVFIDGPGGSGKTYLYTTLYNIFIGKGKNVICVAMSGIAATLLPNGRTVHSTFKLPLKQDLTYSSTMKINSPAAVSLRDVDVVIWDEAPMASKQVLNAVDVLLQEIHGNKLAFGGKIVILGGDFRQTLPIIRKGSEQDHVNACINRSPVWKNLKKFELTSNMRVNNDVETWPSYLISIGNGTIPMDENNFIKLPEDCLSSGDLIGEIFGHSIDRQQINNLSQKVILAPKNTDVANLNNQILEKVLLQPGEQEIEYISTDDLINCTEEERCNFPIEFLNSLTPPGMAPHRLRLRAGAIVMLLRNINIKKGLCNGTRLLIKKLGKLALNCIILTGNNSGREILLPKIDMTLSTESELPFDMRRRQFPITLAFAITINKSQGQTFEKVGIYLENQVFSHGQLYVALSRVKSPQNLYILSGEGNKIKNVVFHNVLK